MDKELTYVLNELLSFMKKDDRTNRGFQSTKTRNDNINRPLGDGTSSMVKVPFTQVQIVDSRGSKDAYKDLIESLRDETKKSTIISEQDRKHNLDTLKKMEYLNTKQKELAEEQLKESQEARKEAKQDISDRLRDI